MAIQYMVHNGPMVTTASYVPVTTGTAVKTMLQVKAPANAPMIIWKWAIDFDGTAASPPVKCELIDTGTVAATITAFVAADITQYGPGQVASQIQVGSTTNSGYTASAEGTITTTRTGALNSVAAGNGDRNEWSLGREFYVPPGNIVRIRVTAAVAVNCACALYWEE
jgi:uncharacterized protein YaiE (UPF0345 family)